MLTIQNLRAVTAGVQPVSLLPGQLCFNVADKLLFVGDGSSTKTSFDGTSVPGVVGGGWFAVPLSFTNFSDYYVINPEYYGDVPVDGEVLAWDETLERVVWKAGSSLENISYITTNSAVTAAPGASLTAKISNALGITPVANDSVIVTGDSGDTYQAFYQYISGDWVYAASYAPPLASEVPITPVAGLTATYVQGALEEVLGLTVAAQATASNALAVANNALPKAGGTMTGNINFNNGQPVDAGSY